MTTAAQDRIGHHFRRGLASYGTDASVQADVARDLAAQITAIAPPQGFATAFEFGCGTGFLTKELLARLTVGHWLINDLVAETAEYVAPLFDQHQTGWAFLPGPVQDLRLPPRLDLIASASTIQWVADTPSLLAKLAGSLAAGGWLALASYAPGHFHELQDYGLAASTMSYHTPGDWRAMLPSGLRLHNITHRPRTLQFANPRDVLRHLRRTGVNGGARGRWSRGDLAAFEADYTRRFSDDTGSVTLTYAPILLLAQKPIA